MRKLITKLITKVLLNKIQRAAYEEFKNYFAEDEFLSMFDNCVSICVWKVTEGTQAKMLVTDQTSQMNTVYLKENGFSDKADIKRLFFVNRQTKQVIFV